MGQVKLSAMEIDAIGEILNISLGASATAVSIMLDARVDITTPKVSVQARDEFEFSNIKPAICLEITYVEGLEGKNIMLLKRQDVKAIIEMLMGMDIPDEEFVMDEMNISAICEVMNQMMGASATALSELLDMPVNISTPKPHEVDSVEEFKEEFFADEEEMVVIHFDLKIEDKMQSEFLNVMPIKLAKKLVSGFLAEMGAAPEEAAPAETSAPAAEIAAQPVEAPIAAPAPAAAETPAASAPAPVAETAPAQTAQPAPAPTAPVQPEPMPQPAAAAAPTPAQPAQAVPAQPMQADPAQPVMPAMTAAPVQQTQMDPGVVNNMMQMMDMMRQSMDMQRQMMQQQIEQSHAPRRIKVHAAPQPNLNGQEETNPDENLDLIMDVPMEVSVEIGRTQKYVKDILDLNKGSLVVLDKLAGDQVDLYVNGQCIAKGDVVVVDDNFGIRITEIL